MRVLQAIENGGVSEEDLIKLRNWCATALMVQNKVTEHVWKRCTREAEITAHMHGQVVDFEDEE